MPTSTSNEQPKRSVARPVANLGNTCYMNAVLQALAHAPELCVAMDCQPHSEICPKALENSREPSPSASSEEGRLMATRKSRRVSTKRLSKDSFCALCAVEDHLKQVHDKSGQGQPVAPNELVNGFVDHVAPWFSHGVQEDSHEFLRVLIDGMQNSCKRKGDINDEEAKKQYPFLLFSGKVESTVTCSKCKTVSSTLDPIEDVGLEVTALPGSTGGTARASSPSLPVLAGVQSAFSRFTGEETLEGYKCEKCNALRQATKQTRLYSIPPILTLHLKRFSYGSDRVAATAAPATRRGGRSELSQLSTPSIHPMPVFASRSGSAKIEGHVKFDVTFDLNPYLCESLQNEKKAMICRLFAVVVHNGKNSHSGHYVAYVRSLSKNEWWKMDDARVESASIKQVMAAEAYMLFYRVVQHPISTKFEEDCKRKFSGKQQSAQDRETPRKRPPAAVEPEVAKKRPKPLPKPEDWFQTNTNIPPALIELVRRAQELVADHVQLTPEFLSNVERAAQKSTGAPTARISDIRNVPSIRERLQNLFFRLSEYLDDPSFLMPRKPAVIEPDTEDELKFFETKSLETKGSVKEGDTIRLMVSQREIEVYFRPHLMDCLHKLNEFASDQKRLFVLSGPAGCGKTCLMMYWARSQGGIGRVLYLHYLEKGVCVVSEMENGTVRHLKAPNGSESLQVSDVAAWLKRHLSSSGAEQYDVCCVDGFRNSGASKDIASFMLTNPTSRKTAVVTSDDLNTEGIPEEALSHVAMDSWTLEDHLAAASSPMVTTDPVRGMLQSDYQILCNGDTSDDSLSSEERLKEAVAAKYHYAGGSARYMYDTGMSDLKELLTKQLEKIHDWNSFAQGSLLASSTKQLVQRFTASGQSASAPRTAVSKFVLRQTFEQCPSTTAAALSIAGQCTGNLVLKDWHFAVKQLSLIRLALEGKSKEQVSLGNANVYFRPTTEVYFDGVCFSDPIQDEAVIWCSKWNQGSFDVALYSSGTLAAISFVVANRHSLKLCDVKQLRGAFVSSKVKIERVVHMTVIGNEKWEDFDNGPVRGSGKDSRRSEKAFQIDLGRSPELSWVEPADASARFETERSVDVFIPK